MRRILLIAVLSLTGLAAVFGQPRTADEAKEIQAAFNSYTAAFTVFSNGSLDANWLVKHGLPTVSFGAGQNEVHTVKEFVDLPEFAIGCRLAVAMATLEGQRFRPPRSVPA
jgi:acetylornithine deacetylase/succinyl-diaminopimelate desuccinylase-like protein